MPSEAPIPGRCAARIRVRDEAGNWTGEIHFCERWPVQGRKRCRNHGGMARRGVDNPAYKGRGWSSMLPDRYLARLEAALADPDLTSMAPELALTDARMGDLIENLASRRSESFWEQLDSFQTRLASALDEENLDELRALADVLTEMRSNALAERSTWESMMGLMQQRRKLADTERKREELLGATMTAKQAMTFIAALQAAIVDIVRDPETRQRLGARIRVLLAGNTNRAARLTPGGRNTLATHQEAERDVGSATATAERGGAPAPTSTGVGEVRVTSDGDGDPDGGTGA